MSNTPLPPANGYSQVVISTPGRIVFVSGQIAVNEHGQVVAPNDLRAQTEQALENLTTALTAAGATFSHVVKVNWYVKNFDDSQINTIREVRSRYFDPNHLPANTLAGVTALCPSEALIEVEAIAIIPEAGK